MRAFPYPDRPVSSGGSSKNVPAMGLTRLALIVGLALLLGSCSQGLNAPFVQLSLVNLPMTTVKIDVDVTLGSIMKMPTPEFTGTASSLADVTISFPPDSRGLLFIALRAIDSTPCIVATGSVAVSLDTNQIYPATIVPMVAAMGCQNPSSMNSLTVSTSGDGKGSVSSLGGAISCGATCTGMFPAGTSVTLTATPDTNAPPGSSYQFVGWNGAGISCTTSPTCQFQLNSPTQAITATFRCSGFCSEAPAGQVQDLYGIWGFLPSDIVAVGKGGTILMWNGTKWTPVTSPVLSALRGIQGAPQSLVGYAVGDGGTILNTINGGAAWTPMTSPTANNLRAVYAPSPTKAYAAGDSLAGNTPYAMYNGFSWGLITQGGYNYNWNAILGVNSTTFMLVGAGGIIRFIVNDTAASPNPNTNVTTDLTGACEFNSTTLIVVGVGGVMLTYDTTQSIFTAIAGTPSTANLRAVACFSGGTAIAVGDGGTVWKYDGMRVTALPAGGTQANLTALWGTSANDFYVVGSGGTLLHNRP